MKLLVVSDLHCGHLLGLKPPPHTEQYQQTLWDYYVESVQNNGPYDAVIANGDLVDGPGKKDASHHATTDMNKQVNMAVESLNVAACDRIYVVQGTGYHTDDNCSFEEFVARELETHARPELRLELYGRKLHARHVVGRSDIPYGQYTQLGKELINDILQAEFEGYDDADIIIRSHVHYCVKIAVADGDGGIMREAITTPALQLRGPAQSSFARKLRTWLYHVGITVIHVHENGVVDIKPIILPIKLYQRREYECLTPLA